MQIDLDLLFIWGATVKEFKKNEIIFNENEDANFYYQVIEGTVRMYNFNEDGKEFTQMYFNKGRSFGEPPLFIDQKYPASAIASQDCRIVKLAKEKFLKILDEYPSVQKDLLRLLSYRIYNQIKISKDIINRKPEFRIMTFLNAYKEGNGDSKKLIPFTRQEIANFTGLRVETVIRELTKMSKMQKVEIINHKIYY